MKQYGLLLISIIIFFVLFYNLTNEKTKPVQMETFSPMSLNINYQSNAVDSVYLNEKNAKLVNLKNELSELRNTLYNKNIADFLVIQPKYKSPDDSNPQQFDVEIIKEGNFSNTLKLSVPIGIKGEQGPNGNKGAQGPQGADGERGPVGQCGTIIK